ncbi:hypothetical protein HYT23_00610 [Candidatus Pacearchaeota archaeon]|nr:hypothetical protein [Candidatus Pacearchaeota archaeon]
MEEKYSKNDIRRRLVKMRKETGGEERDSAILSRMAYEFGIDEIRYNVKMSDREIVNVTFNCQTNPSQLELEVENELRQYL